MYIHWFINREIVVVDKKKIELKIKIILRPPFGIHYTSFFLQLIFACGKLSRCHMLSPDWLVRNHNSAFEEATKRRHLTRNLQERILSVTERASCQRRGSFFGRVGWGIFWGWGRRLQGRGSLREWGVLDRVFWRRGRFFFWEILELKKRGGRSGTWGEVFL